jgi:hypothetical protein
METLLSELRHQSDNDVSKSTLLRHEKGKEKKMRKG